MSRRPLDLINKMVLIKQLSQGLRIGAPSVLEVDLLGPNYRALVGAVLELPGGWGGFEPPS